NLIAPHFLDATQANLAAAGGGVLFTAGAISDEAQGTYTAAVWAKSKDDVDQAFVRADFQIGTATVETYASGGPDDSTCASCHTDDRWQSRPSRLACGSCHDNLYFDKGTLDPVRSFGAPKAGPCVADADCASFGGLTTCSAGVCVRGKHPMQNSDTQCSVCHN